MKWGILSTARIAELVLAACEGSQSVGFEAVASRSAHTAEAFAKRHGIARSYGSYEELLRDPDIDAVYVPLPNALHVPWTIAALEHGKHVLCEKPFSSRPEEVARAHEVARARGLLLAEAFMYRFHPQTDAVRELVAEGRIGRIALIKATHSFVMRAAAERDFRADSEMEGGALMDVGCYCVSAARMLAGEPNELHASAVRMRSGPDIRFSAVMRCAEDVVVHFDCAMDLPFRGELEIVGTEGTIVLSDPWHCHDGTFTLRDVDGVAKEVSVPAIDRYLAQLEAVSRAIACQEQLEFGAQDAIAQAATLERLLLAAGLRPSSAPSLAGETA